MYNISSSNLILVQICFNYPQETLISISGYVGNCFSPCVIKSLKFETNMRKIGPFGEEKGMHFSLPRMGGKIVGFYGKSGVILDSIGVYYQPLKIIRQPKLHIASWEKLGPNILIGCLD